MPKYSAHASSLSCSSSMKFMRLLELINASKDLTAVKVLFGSCVTWENFAAKRAGLMQTYVQRCICYRDFLDCHTSEPQIANLPVDATFASATSAVADAGILLQLIGLLELLAGLESDHRLLIVLVIALYQQLFLDYNSSYLGQYSTCFPVDSPRNPAFPRHKPRWWRENNQYVRS